MKRFILKRFGGWLNLVMVIILAFGTFYLIHSFTSSSAKSSVSRNKEPSAKLYRAAGIVQVESACIIDKVCNDESIPYKVQSGTGLTTFPLACINGKVVIGSKKESISRGITIALLDIRTLQVQSVQTFDTYVGDTGLLRFLKFNTTSDHLVVVVTYDEAGQALTEDGKIWLSYFGSSKVKQLKYRDTFALIGQRGLEEGQGLEKLEARGSNDFALQSEIAGCMQLPLGKLRNITAPKANIKEKQDIQMGPLSEYCGLLDACKPNEMAVRVYIGKDMNDEPKICVNGRYVLSKQTNDGGRGVNVVVLDPHSKQILRVGRFDTWVEDSSTLEIFLESLVKDEVIIAVTFDEASTNLGTLARLLFGKLGSQKVANVEFRSQWFMASQVGRTNVVEELVPAGSGGQYPPSLDKKFCMPISVPSQKIRPDPLVYINEKRKRFCSSHPGFDDFCSPDNVNQPLNPAPLVNNSYQGNPIFNTPIVLVAGMSPNSLRRCLETLLLQGGIIPGNVLVVIDEAFKEIGELVDLFGFQVEYLQSEKKYSLLFMAAMKHAWEAFPSKEAILFVEEELILSPDWLLYFAQLFKVFMADTTLAAISSWNPNGFDALKQHPGVVHRAAEFPGVAFLLKKSIFEQFMASDLKQCCLDRTWRGWFANSTFSYETLYPALSRIQLNHYKGIHSSAVYVEQLLNRPRSFNIDSIPELANVMMLSADEYERYLTDAIRSGILVSPKSFTACSSDAGPLQLSLQANQNYIIMYDQEESSDFRSLLALCRCFNLFSFEPRGLHRGVLRMSLMKNTEVFLVGTLSPYEKLRTNEVPFRHERN